jgi:RNA polymerase sigma-70 factor (ECF subfamily)
MTTTSASLLERLRRPAERDAWDRFVDLYTPLLYYWARRLGLGEPDAADLVQDVFTLLLRKLPEFDYDREKSFRSWLRVVTINKWREHQRQARQRPGAQGSLSDVVGPGPSEEVWESEYRHYLAGRALRLMQREFEPSTWKACWEVTVNGRPTAEVAAELGLSVGAVRVAKFRVLARLRQELEGLLD